MRNTSKYRKEKVAVCKAGEAELRARRGWGFLILVPLLVFILSSAVRKLNAQELQEIRKEYFSMKEDECRWMEVAGQIKDTSDPVLLAYHGALLAASSNCVDGALNKLRRFKEGRQKLEKAVDLKPDNLEIRFLRYSIKVKSPGILNYNDVEKDKSYILGNLMPAVEQYDQYLLHEICSFMLDHGDLNENERDKIEDIYP